jgi:hypothetical protein
LEVAAMQTRPASKILRDGLSSALDTWYERGSGQNDLFYWTLRMKLAQANGGAEAVLRQVPSAVASDVLRTHRAINRYFDNIRYALLDPVTQLWGTVVNALRVAADVEGVTGPQRTAFAFPIASLCELLRALQASPRDCEALYEAFRPMPAPDCQVLAALLSPDLDVAFDVDCVIKLVRLLSGEGPLMAQDREAFTVLSHSGLIEAAFRGVRNAG